MRVLLIDDDVNHIVLFQAIFRRMHYDVLYARTAADGIGLLAHAPDVILLDLIMPPDHGFSVLEHLQREHSPLLHRVIILTAMPTLVDDVLGDLCVVHKPFDLDEVIRLVAQRAVAPLDAPLPPLPRLHEWPDRVARTRWA